MLVTKIINGSNSIIRLGTYIAVRAAGTRKFTSVFLKNSISSNKFKIIPNK